MQLTQLLLGTIRAPMPWAEHERLQVVLSLEHSEWDAVNPIAAGTVWAPMPQAEDGFEFSLWGLWLSHKCLLAALSHCYMIVRQSGAATFCPLSMLLRVVDRVYCWTSEERRTGCLSLSNCQGRGSETQSAM